MVGVDEGQMVSETTPPALVAPPQPRNTNMVSMVAGQWSRNREAWLVTWQHNQAARAYELQTNSDPSVTHRWSSVWCGSDEGAWVVPYASKMGSWIRLRAIYTSGYGPWCDPLFLKPGADKVEKAA